MSDPEIRSLTPLPDYPNLETVHRITERTGIIKVSTLDVCPDLTIDVNDLSITLMCSGEHSIDLWVGIYSDKLWPRLPKGPVFIRSERDVRRLKSIDLSGSLHFRHRLKGPTILPVMFPRGRGCFTVSYDIPDYVAPFDALLRHDVRLSRHPLTIDSLRR